MSTGYQGFRCWAAHPCSSLKPGESYQQRDSKFQTAGRGVVYDQQSSDLEADPYRTLQQTSERSSVPGVYKVPDRRGVAATYDSRDAAMAPKPFTAKTIYNSHFPDYQKNAKSFSSLTESQIQEAFERIDTDNSGFIELKEIRAFLCEAYGGEREPSKEELGLFLGTFDKNADGKLSLKEVLGKLPWLKQQLEARAATGTGRLVVPGWEKGRQKVPQVIKSHPMASSNQLDMGAAGESPLARPFLQKSGMASTTGDLYLGTTKDTYHIPGYGGFVPTTMSARNVRLHGMAEQQRAPLTNLRLYHSLDMPGYTGHKPIATQNDRGERLSGLDPRTTSGSSSILHATQGRDS